LYVVFGERTPHPVPKPPPQFCRVACAIWLVCAPFDPSQTLGDCWKQSCQVVMGREGWRTGGNEQAIAALGDVGGEVNSQPMSDHICGAHTSNLTPTHMTAGSSVWQGLLATQWYAIDPRGTGGGRVQTAPVVIPLVVGARTRGSHPRWRIARHSTTLG